ncbi:MAG: ABC transporter ATP-binding protein [Thermoplasmata archaeon]|nr:ABC transporter ATP-binding protein [Thermoplasmata archaeon]
MAVTMLEIIHLTKVFGTVKAVDNLSFKVEKGEIYGLLGTNGAGKTTTMKILACLLKPTSGRALVNGADVVEKPLEVKSQIGYLPEMPSLFEKLTGREFLFMLGTLRKMPEELLDRRVGKFADVLELDEALDMELGIYSKGMRQRISFASAILHEPPILILDEPTSGLDPRFARLVKKWIKDYVGNGNLVLMSTHVTEIAESLCHRVAIIHDGKIVGEGTPSQLSEAAGMGNLEDTFVKLVDAGRG